MVPSRLLGIFWASALAPSARAASGNSRITSISPSSLSVNHATTITFTGSSYIAGDKVSFLLDCSTGAPTTDISSGSASFVLTGTGTYKVCFQAAGQSDSVEQLSISMTSVAATSTAAISAISPAGITINTATVISFTGYTTGDLAIFAATGTCASATPSVDISSGSGTFTLTGTGSYDLCLRASGGSDEIAQAASASKLTVQAATSATAITAVSPTSLTASRSSGLALTFSGTAESGDLAILILSTSSCTGQTPTVDVSSGLGYFTVAPAGTYKLCFREKGGSDSVEQTGISVTALSTTAPETFSSLTPSSISASYTSTVAFFPLPASGDKAEFVASGSACPGIPGTDISSGSASFLLGSAGAKDLCLYTVAGGGIVKQTSVTLTVVSGTPSNTITAILPTTISVGSATSIALSGHVVGSYADFVLIGTPCSAILPSTTLTASGVGTFSFSNPGTYTLCYRQAGRTDSINQVAVSLAVAAAGVGNDPIAWYGDLKRVFVLPPGELVPLLKAPDMTLSGSTFEGVTPAEQWFGRMVIESPDGGRFMEIAIRKDILSFNRSGAPRDGFETLEITMGGHSPQNELLATRVPTLDTPIPYSFFGADVAFRRVLRSDRTQFPTIGRARRECMDFVGGYLHFYICSAAAWEYFGWQAHLAVRFAHLDLVIVQASDMKQVSGLLPELWGLKPLSKESAAYLNDTDASSANASANSSDFCPGAAWAGGPTPERLARSCGEPDRAILSV